MAKGISKGVALLNYVCSAGAMGLLFPFLWQNDPTNYCWQAALARFLFFVGLFIGLDVVFTKK